jgi:aspartate racemase
MNGSKYGRCLGIIGGLGVGATVHYYQTIIRAHQEHGRVPRLVIAHADVDRVLGSVRDRNFSDLAQYLADFANQLADAGAEVIAIAAITPHICFVEMAQQSRLPIVNLLDEIVGEIASRGLKRVALFGTRFTIESDLFGYLDGFDVVRPRPEEIDYIHDTYVEIVNSGRGGEKHETGLRRLAHTLSERDGAQSIVLAGTELALVFNDANTDFPAIDCMRVHIDAIMRRLVA